MGEQAKGLSANVIVRLKETWGQEYDVLLTFCDFPAEHWIHVRTTNSIESIFATIRLRHRRTKGNGTRRASLTLMFKLAQSAQSIGVASTATP